MLINALLIAPAVAADLEISVTDTTGQPLAALQSFDVQDVQPAPLVIDVASGRQVLEIGYRKSGKDCLVTASVHPIDADPPAQAQANIVTRCGKCEFRTIVITRIGPSRSPGSGHRDRADRASRSPGSVHGDHPDRSIVITAIVGTAGCTSP